MKEPTGIIDKFLYPLEVAAQAHRGIRTAGQYEWMSDLSSADLGILIEELQVETTRALTQFFLNHRLELLELFELWLADREQKEQINVNSVNPIEPENLA